jgi:hypothetical protein
LNDQPARNKLNPTQVRFAGSLAREILKRRQITN